MPHTPADRPPAAQRLLDELNKTVTQAGMSARRLAGAERNGPGKSTWNRWLRGEHPVPQEEVRRLARICGADELELLALWDEFDEERERRGRPPGDETPHDEDDPGPAAASDGEPDSEPGTTPVETTPVETTPVETTPGGGAGPRRLRLPRTRFARITAAAAVAVVGAAAGVAVAVSSGPDHPKQHCLTERDPADTRVSAVVCIIRDADGSHVTSSFAYHGGAAGRRLTSDVVLVNPCPFGHADCHGSPRAATHGLRARAVAEPGFLYNACVSWQDSAGWHADWVCTLPFKVEE